VLIAAALGLLTWPFAAGAQSLWPYGYQPLRALQPTAPISAPTTGREVAYSVTVFQDGSLRVFDARGKPVRPRSIDSVSELPIKRILSLKPVISSIEVQGSHYMLVYSGHQLYVVPLPHY
jgi:hypothetical protein